MRPLDSRSPLKAPPLRYAGQSLDQEINRLVNDGVMPYIAVALCVVWIAIYEWYRWYVGAPPQPVLLTFVAIGMMLVAAFKVWTTRKRMRRLRLGRDGERVVGQFLEQLREQGFQIFHDVPTGRGNLDHVMLGPQGVFAIETKTVSKPRRGDAKVRFDGERVVVGGHKPDRDPIAQARAEASWLRQFLCESSGRSVTVRPIVVYPGWYVESERSQGDGDVWVLNPRALPAFVEHAPHVLLAEDVKLLSYHLSRYVRSQLASTG